MLSIYDPVQWFINEKLVSVEGFSMTPPPNKILFSMGSLPKEALKFPKYPTCAGIRKITFEVDAFFDSTENFNLTVTQGYNKVIFKDCHVISRGACTREYAESKCGPYENIVVAWEDVEGDFDKIFKLVTTERN